MSETPLIRVWEASSLPPGWLEGRRTMGGGMTEELEAHVRSIIDAVGEEGDAALARFTKEFDHVDFDPEDFRVAEEEIEKAYGKVTRGQVSALRLLKGRLERLEKTILEGMSVTIEDDGIRVYRRPRPIESVGCYVPGGEAAYPSTLVMTVTPAKVAGVPRVALCSPPTHGGTVNPLALVAADLVGADEVFRVGGPQAIAALAYGTESIKPVRKIVGAGNEYVTMAKILVSRHVAVDMPAGPSEILILADETAEPRIVALDMISQAEHRAEGISGLITTSKRLAKDVVEELGRRISSLPRGDIVSRALSSRGFIITCEAMEEAIRLANAFAPEHLEVLTGEPGEVAEGVTSAGLVLMGEYTPVSASDYAIGTNHVLPTGGFAHVFSGLSVLDFVKWIGFAQCSKGGLMRLREAVGVLAEAENLPNHRLAVEGRFQLG